MSPQPPPSLSPPPSGPRGLEAPDGGGGGPPGEAGRDRRQVPLRQHGARPDAVDGGRHPPDRGPGEAPVRSPCLDVPSVREHDNGIWKNNARLDYAH